MSRCRADEAKGTCKEGKGRMTKTPTYILHDPLVRQHHFPILQFVLGEINLWYRDIRPFFDRFDGIGRLGGRGRGGS